MRWVDRRAVPVPESLAGSTSLAARERARAIQHFRTTPTTKFKFRAYREDDVATALNTLFFGKCAYCESSIRAVQPTDIEHFRPKGRVAGCPEHPGYWWHAASWENLLASCIDCNRRRYQDAQQTEQTPLEDEVEGQFYLGKGDLFPILGPQRAFAASDDHEAEDPALIDPTRRDPKQHLKWMLEQELSVVGPQAPTGQVDPYGYHTYRVFGLNRQGLVEQRTARWREIKAQIAAIESQLDLAITMPEPYAADLQNLAFQQVDALYAYAAPDQQYSAMVEDLLAAEIERLLAKYQRFEA